MRKRFLLLALILLPAVAYPAIIEQNHWDTMSWSKFDRTNISQVQCATPGDPIGYAESITCSSDAYCSTTPDPSKVLRITFKGTSGHALRSGQTPASVTYPVNTGPILWVKYWFKYSSNYQWEPTQNKHFYLTNNQSGAVPNSTLLLIFGIRDGAHKPAVSIAGGVGNWYQNTGTTVNIQTNRWYKFKGYFHMNTGANDGGWKIWIDDQLIINNPTGMPLRQTSLYGGLDTVEDFLWEPVWGGAGAGCVNQDMYLYADDIILSTTDPGGGDAGDVTDPYLDTFSPSDGASGVSQGTTSVSFHFKDSGTGAEGADNTSLEIACSSPSIAAKNCGDANFACTGGSSDITATLSGLTLSYDQQFSCTVNGSDLAGNVMAQYTYNFTVQADPNPALAVTTTTLPDGTVGTAYSQTLAATGGVSPYTWAVTVGTLPAGLALSAAGAITGTPTTAGVSTFTVTATDSGTPSTDDQELSITIAAATPGGDTTTQNTNFADTYINSGSAGTNYSDNAALRVYQWPAATVANRIILMDNTDIQSIPDNVSITGATLRLYLTDYDGSGGTNPMRVHAYPLIGSVPDTTTATWTNFDNSAIGSELGVTEVSTTLGWYEWNVLAAVQAAYAARAPVYVMLDGSSDGATDTNRYFASVDHATEAWRPQLVITYTQLTAPGGIRISVPGSLRVSTFGGTMK